MSLRLNIINALYNAMNDGYDEELMAMSPRDIAYDMAGHDLFDEETQFEEVVAILENLRAEGDV